MSIRVRFAPSPTGPFSFGNARTALFNWLFAKNQNGEFLLRIEDTDKERSKKKYERDIVQGLKWLGLKWDEKIIRQSERLKIYQKYLTQLLNEGKVYYCFCSREKLEMERQAQLSEGLVPRYGGSCRQLEPVEARERAKKEPAVIRFKIPAVKIEVNDLIRGRIDFDASLIGDIVIARNLRQPLYNFAAVVDDFETNVTHVIRGEDHLSNTPKQIMLQKALNFPEPQYAHLPLILGPDKKKLSKRFLDSSLNDFRQEGYLPEAVLNFLVLLGWHPTPDREVIGLEEMIKEFDLKKVQKSGAVFNRQKLDWLNSHYIRKTDAENLLIHLKPFLPVSWFNKPGFLKKIVELEKERIKNLKDFGTASRFFFRLPEYQTNLLVWQTTPRSEVLDNLKTVETLLKGFSEKPFTKTEFEASLTDLAGERGRGQVFWPLRVALSGQAASPGPLEMLEILGRNESLKRINKAITKLKKAASVLNDTF